MGQTRAQRNPVETETILRIAGRHFAEKGFAGARMDEIADEAGVNKATLYYRIGDKETLYETVITATMDDALYDVQQAIQKSADPEQQLRSHIEILAKHIETHPCFSALMMRELAGGAENVYQPVLERVHQIFALLAQILANGVTQQKFRQLNPFLIHMQIVGSLMFYSAGAPMRQRIIDLKGDSNGIGTPLDEAASQLADIILHAVRL